MQRAFTDRLKAMQWFLAMGLCDYNGTGGISQVIEDYIQCPEAELMNTFESDRWGITDILRLCDRRIGKRRLRELRSVVDDEVLSRIIDRRLRYTEI